jgi:adenylosuccinate synthase
MAVRTYPIRVGNTENSSGPPYEDQAEIEWEDIGVEPEYTTVTGRKRRVFTWSNTQFREAVRINEPNIIFINFLNYLDEKGEQSAFIDNVIHQYKLEMRKKPELVLGGFGPKDEDIEVLT